MQIGDVIDGRYELLAEIGAGGMGRVLRARDRTLGRDVAVKLLAPNLLGDEDAVAALRDEARQAARVRHPNVVQVLDAVLDGTDQPAIVMEYVDGPSLAAVIPDDGMALEEALEVVHAVGRGLAAVHASGLVHQDVTPANVLLDGGVPRLTDFGIARSDSAAGTTTIRGSVPYLAPEQADAAPVGPAADIYALGCLATTLLTGSPPFSANHPVAVVHKHLNEPAPDVRDRAPDVPPEVAAGIAAALRKDPADRPGSVQEWLDALGFAPAAPASRTPTASQDARAAGTSVLPVGAAAASETVADDAATRAMDGEASGVVATDPEEDERRLLGPLLLAGLAVLLLAWLAIAGLSGSGDPRTASVTSPSPTATPDPSPSPSPSPAAETEAPAETQEEAPAETQEKNGPGGPPADAGPDEEGPPGQSEDGPGGGRDPGGGGP